MNYVLLDADNVVVARSTVASAFAESEGLTIAETEAWPEPGMVSDGEGGFLPHVVPIALQKVRKSAEVMNERDRRIDGGFVFEGIRYQSRPADRENVAGAAQLAAMAIIIDGKELDDLRWHGGDADFVWIAEDNSEVAMDAPTVMEFAKAAAAMKSACIFHAKALKNQIDEAADQADLEAIDLSAGWPS